MNRCRRIPLISFTVNPYKRAKINLSGCNFDCKGCFAIARKDAGKALSVDALIDLLIKSCNVIYGEMINDVQLTGGEPTTDIDYMLLLIQRLKDLNVNNIGISTNGYLLNQKVIYLLKTLDVSYVILDLKAFSNEIHKWYTSHSNSTILKAIVLLNKYKINFYIRTIFIPDIVDLEEIDRIAWFLNRVNRNIPYKIYQFSAEYSNNDCLRKRPDYKNMKDAFSIAKKYLNNVSVFVTDPLQEADADVIEVRADELLDEFAEFECISRSPIKKCNRTYLTMKQILSLYCKNEKK